MDILYDWDFWHRRGKKIQVIEQKQIILNGRHYIPIPKGGFRKLKNAFFDYIFTRRTPNEWLRDISANCKICRTWDFFNTV